jgi:hypothetical protein
MTNPSTYAIRLSPCHSGPSVSLASDRAGILLGLGQGEPEDDVHQQTGYQWEYGEDHVEDPYNGRAPAEPLGHADNLETLYGAIGDGALAVRIPKHARKELEAYLDCGLLCRGFARLKCEECGERRLVAFSCRGRGFCPSCTGRRMNATAANLIERVLPPPSGLRQWC